MCGIAGILNLSSNKRADEDVILRMVSVLNHRGPEQSGVYYDEDIHLGHSRLSIIGLEMGIQPISSQDGRFVIIYNGEVFNYIELQNELKKNGHTFKTDTDTEVILHLYEEKGPECLSDLNGQFAIAIWDFKKKELFLARDRVGICPLYYTFQNRRFSFASEIKALFMDKSIKREIDLQSLKQIFTCWTTVGSRSAFENIKELCPGKYMIIKNDSLKDEQHFYWSLPYVGRKDNERGTQEEAVGRLQYILEDAVRIRLRADVPVGAYLSGGLDSSVITSIISEKFNNRLKTFSLGFKEESFDESEYQSVMTAYLNTDHYQTSVKNEDISNNLSRVIWHCEKPLLRTGPVPLFMLSKFVRDNNFKVVLTGEGADEIFGGYNIFKEAKVRAFWANQPGSVYRPLLLKKLYPYIFEKQGNNIAFLKKFFAVTPEDLNDPFMSHRKRWKNTQRCTMFFSRDVISKLSEFNPVDEISDILPENFVGRDLLSRAQWLEMKIFMSNYLLSSQGDRVAMANAVELRLPFLDHRLIEFAAGLPAHWKIFGLDEKYLLKKAYKHKLPEAIINRKKQPYRAPISQAVLCNGNDRFNDLLKEEYFNSTGIFNGKKVMNLFNKCLYKGKGSVSESENMAILGIISTQIVIDRFIEKFDNFTINPAVIGKTMRRTRTGMISEV